MPLQGHHLTRCPGPIAYQGKWYKYPLERVVLVQPMRLSLSGPEGAPEGGYINTSNLRCRMRTTVSVTAVG